MGEYSKIEILQRMMEALAKKSEGDVRGILLSGLLIDGQRMQTVQRFSEHGFTVTCSEAGITDRLETVEEMREFWLAQAGTTLLSLPGDVALLPSSLTVLEDDPSSFRRYARIRVSIAECVYVAAQCKTEIAARGRERWSEIGRLLCEEEIARLQWEICKSGDVSNVRTDETKGEGEMSESNYQWPCWFCKLGLDQMCLRPRSVEYGPVSVCYTCQGHRCNRFHVGGYLVRSIAALLNRDRNRKG